MPTTDERREVAARLRAIDDTEWTHPRDELRALDEAIETSQGMPYAIQTTWGRLADLIEPELLNCETCPQMDDPDSFIFHLLQAEQHERTVNLTEAVDAICGEMCGDGWDWHNRAEAVVKTVAEMCGAKVVEQ